MGWRMLWSYNALEWNGKGRSGVPYFAARLSHRSLTTTAFSLASLRAFSAASFSLQNTRQVRTILSVNRNAAQGLVFPLEKTQQQGHFPFVFGLLFCKKRERGVQKGQQQLQGSMSRCILLPIKCHQVRKSLAVARSAAQFLQRYLAPLPFAKSNMKPFREFRQEQDTTSSTCI